MTIHALRSGPTAATLLAHPMRATILAMAREPVSASELARRLGQPRQRVNYHVRQLAAVGLLRAAGQQKKRNMVEQQYQASADSYVLGPELLESAGPPLPDAGDSASAAHLVALCARAQSEVVQVMESAHAAGLRARTLSLQHDLHFESVEQRADFTRALLDAVNDVCARYGSSARGRPFRLLLGCYPVPGDAP